MRFICQAVLIVWAAVLAAVPGQAAESQPWTAVVKQDALTDEVSRRVCAAHKDLEVRSSDCRPRRRRGDTRPGGENGAHRGRHIQGDAEDVVRLYKRREVASRGAGAPKNGGVRNKRARAR